MILNTHLINFLWCFQSFSVLIFFSNQTNIMQWNPIVAGLFTTDQPTWHHHPYCQPLSQPSTVTSVTFVARHSRTYQGISCLLNMRKMHHSSLACMDKAKPLRITGTKTWNFQPNVSTFSRNSLEPIPVFLFLCRTQNLNWFLPLCQQIEANVDSSDASETNTFETTMPSGETFFLQREDRAMFEELIRLLPEVVTELGKQDPIHAQRLKDMFILIREGSFPFDNISYLLFEGVIQWFRCKDIRSMSNSEQVKLFMATGRKLFGNCFVEFMRGPGFKYSDKSSNSLTLEDSHMNFAVPSFPTLLNLNSDDIPARLDPGFLHQVVDSYIKNNPDALTIEHGVSGDFKTAARSKEDRLGMVDLLGYEPEPTKAQKTIPPWSQPY